MNIVHNNKNTKEINVASQKCFLMLLLYFISDVLPHFEQQNSPSDLIIKAHKKLICSWQYGHLGRFIDNKTTPPNHARLSENRFKSVTGDI